MLPLSHDEVVHGKRSLLSKMPGDAWQQLANLRLLYGFMYGHPGKKLLFMGAELAQWEEWDHQRELHWHLLDDESPSRRLSLALRSQTGSIAAVRPCTAPMHIPMVFEWIDCADSAQSIAAFARRTSREKKPLIFVCNFYPSPPARDYRLGLPTAGPYREVLNSDAEIYGRQRRGPRWLGAYRERSPATAGRTRRGCACRHWAC